MANNFHPSLERISSSVRHDHSQHHYAPFLDDLPAESSDIPLDAFDRELLAECLTEAPPQFDSSHGRRLPPSAVFQTPINTGLSTRASMHGLFSPSSQTHPSSSSSIHPVSSPTVVALQNRSSLHPSGSIRAHLEGRNEFGRSKPHDAMSVLPAGDNIPTSPQCGRPAGPNYKPSGGITRLGLGHAPPIVYGIPLLSTTELPDRYRSIFPFPTFGAVQSKCFNLAFQSSDNLVVSAPTGSGKTAVMELAICRLLHSNKPGDFKVVYQSPTKSLCAERMRDWSGKFKTLDLTCAELTGDTEQSQLRNVQSASIIITTPEKWDSVTRKWKDNTRLMKMVRLFLIDEVHILKEARGAALEAVVSRMKSAGSNVRFIALSATVPNSDDIATWLGKTLDAQHLPAHREVFGEIFRPVKLEKHVWSIRGPPNDFAFDKVLDEHLKQALAAHSRRKPTMIFCSTRKMAVDTAKMLSALFSASHSSHQLWPAPKMDYRPMDPELSKTIAAGVAFHHGGVDAADRRVVEDSFLTNDISIICCTSTLAVGVNLPCYLVVIKGTASWTDKGMQEYSDLEIMQMLGRAGRPQFENSACSVILTRPEKKELYERMVSGDEILESCLHVNLIDHLNSEIGLGTVEDIESAKKWLASTFLFVRLQKNPRHYQLQEELDQCTTDEFLESICSKNIGFLRNAQLISEKSRFKCTEFGDAMARYYIRFETMRTILAMPPKAKVSEALSTLAQAAEFREIRFKSGEKGLYKELNGDVGIRFPIKVDVAQNAHKISLLIQSELGGSIFPGHDKWKKHRTQFNLDKATIFSHVNRLIRCMIDCQLHKEDAISVGNLLELARSLAAKVWDNSPFQLKQIEGIGDVGVRKLAHVGVNSIEALQNTEPHRIETVLSRLPPFGQKMLSKAADFPSLHVSVKEMGNERRPGKGVKINFKVDIGFVNEKIPIFFRRKMIYVCFLAATSHGQLIDFRRWATKRLENGQEILLSVQLTKPTSHIICHIMCDEIAGTSRRAELKLNAFLPVYFPSPEPTVSGDIEKDGVLQRSPDLEEYGDVEDADLVALLESQEGEVAVIHDLDDIVDQKNSGNKAVKKNSKRAANKISTDQETDLRTYRESVQLKNGNWTCQHTCRERNRSCRHVCCAEGVKEPSKPSQTRLARKSSKKGVADGHEGVDKRATKAPAEKPSPSEKSCLEVEAKKHNHAQPIAQNAKKANKTIQSTQRKCKSSSLKASLHRYEACPVSKLSFIQNLNSSEKAVYDTEEGRDSGIEDLGDGHGQPYLAGHETHDADFEIDHFSFGSDNEINDILEVDKKIDSARSTQDEVWRTVRHQNAGKLHTVSRVNKPIEMTVKESMRNENLSRNRSHSSLESQRGFDEFQAPPGEGFKQKGASPFTLGENSSLESLSQSHTEPSAEDVAQFEDSTLDALIASLQPEDYSANGLTVKRQKLRHLADDTSSQCYVDEPIAIPSRSIQEDASSSMKAQDNPSSPADGGCRGMSLIEDPLAESRDEKKKSKEKEEEALDAAFYAEFGDYVEIVST